MTSQPKKHGGKRDGAGAKPKPPELKKVKLSHWYRPCVAEWLRAQTTSQAVLIDEALCEKYGITSNSGKIEV